MNMVMVRDVPDPEKAPEDDRFSSEMLVRQLCEMGLDARLFPDGVAIAEYLADEVCREGDVVVVLSNGDFDNIHEHLLSCLARP
jgi:UDP-N-acetylmuramate: L-alanyl-gamma-D-glutamyl-meso-diaminopimelate ligase